MPSTFFYPVNFGVGIGLLMATVIIHMLSLMALRERLHHLRVPTTRRRYVLQESLVAMAVVMLLSVIHISEVVVWGMAYNALGAVRGLDDAIYFSLTTYTTVGPEGIDILPTFRGIAGFESLIGPIMVAWSTAFLVESVAQLRANFYARQPGA